MSHYKDVTIQIGQQFIHEQEVTIEGGGFSSTSGAKGESYRATIPTEVYWYRGAKHFSLLDQDPVSITQADGTLLAEGLPYDPQAQPVDDGDASFKLRRR